MAFNSFNHTTLIGVTIITFVISSLVVLLLIPDSYLQWALEVPNRLLLIIALHIALFLLAIVIIYIFQLPNPVRLTYMTWQLCFMLAVASTFPDIVLNVLAAFDVEDNEFVFRMERFSAQTGDNILYPLLGLLITTILYFFFYGEKRQTY